MAQPRRALCTLTAVALALLAPGALAAQKDGEGPRKPSLSLRANPPSGFSPLKVRITVDVRDGANDHPDFYCPEVEWEWGDGTTSATSEDCDPYVAGTSEIRRRYSTEHTYREAGAYRLVFRLKQKNKVVGVAGANIQVRGGIREGF